MSTGTAAWLLLITNLPGRNPTLRMRIWRALKAAGAGLLRDGVYVMPNSEANRRVLEQQGEDIRAGGGLIQILCLDTESEEQSASLVALFDRTPEHARLVRRLDALKRELPRLRESESRQKLAAIRRDVATLRVRDFFPAQAQQQTERALEDAEAAVNERFAPDEPHAARQRIKARQRAAYRGRTWATREHIWIDRVASAWLIGRFIDPSAKFLWLKRARDCPKRAVGFDFDGAEFTHVDSRVTFEVLVSSFGLENDPGLSKLSALVHYLDVGGIPVAEAAGFASIMAGARVIQKDDNALLKAMAVVLDSLYTAYARPSDS